MTLIMTEIDPTDNPDIPDDLVDEWDDTAEKEWVDEDDDESDIKDESTELPDGFHEVDEEEEAIIDNISDITEKTT